MENLLNDIRYGLRILVKSPGFTAVVILTLALGIGANAAIFSVVNTVLLRPLPYAHAELLVNVWGKMTNEGLPKNHFSEPEWWELRDTNQAFTGVAAYALGGGQNLTSSGKEPVRIMSAAASANIFDLLGVQAIQGRVFSADEDQPGKSHVALLSYALWKSQFGSDPNISGRTVRLDDDVYSIVGVLPDGFNFGGKQDIWVPLGLDRAKPQGRGAHYLRVLGRTKSNLSLQQANIDMERFGKQLIREYPEYYIRNADLGFGIFAVPLQEELVGSVRQALIVLLAAVFFVLLIACANVANLLLVRASSREKEVSIRAALGAGGWRLGRQLLTENILLAVLGGALGLLLAYWGVEGLKLMAPERLPNVSAIGVDARVLLFTAVLTLGTGIVFGLAPIARVVRANLALALREGGRGTLGSGSHKLRNALVVSEIALALMLLVGAGLMIRSFQQLLQVNPGFQPDHVLAVELSLPKNRYPDDMKSSTFYREALDRVRALPGVQAAGAVSELPLNEEYSSGSVFLEDTSVQSVQRTTFDGPGSAILPYLETDARATTSGYLEAMKVPLVRGRYLTLGDTADSQYVIVVDTDFANRFWPTSDPIGKRLAFDTIPNTKPAQIRWRTIVGVVGHVKQYGLDVKGREQAYFPLSQSSGYLQMTLAVRTSSSPESMTGSIREAINALDKDLPLFGVKTMDALMATSTAQARLNMSLLALFASLALALAAVGIYGVMSYAVTQRTQEIGIRLAIGAQAKDVMRMVVGEGLKLAVIGAGVGLVGAFIVARLISTLFFGIAPHDPLTFAGITALLGFVAFLACYIPARRATRVDPLVALRYE
jgi:putative ABC transport system permease protein